MKKICHKVFLNVQAYRSLGLSNLSDIVFEFDNGGKRKNYSKQKVQEIRVQYLIRIIDK